jgi:hypothetical protein
MFNTAKGSVTFYLLVDGDEVADAKLVLSGSN